jgi:AGZA family xanthine/uracil permease-like MFS transporter
LEQIITTTERPRRTIADALDRRFRYTERGSSLSREVRGGLVTFVTMAYIVILNPLIIGGFTPDQAATDVAGR